MSERCLSIRYFYPEKNSLKKIYRLYVKFQIEMLQAKQTSLILLLLLLSSYFKNVLKRKLIIYNDIRL